MEPTTPIRDMEPTTVTRAPASRWAAAAGSGFAVLMLYALLGPPSGPDQNAPGGVWEAFMADTSNQIWIVVEGGAGIIAGILFVAFMAGLRQHGSLPPTTGLSVLGYGCGLLFVMSIFATFTAWVSVPAAALIGGEPVPTADVLRLSGDLGRAFLGLPVPLCAGVFAIAVGWDARTTHAIPRWLGVAGVVVGIVELVAGIHFLPLLLFPVWVAAASVALLRPKSTRRLGP
jgi:hypothetical protein